MHQFSGRPTLTEGRSTFGAIKTTEAHPARASCPSTSSAGSSGSTADAASCGRGVMALTSEVTGATGEFAIAQPSAIRALMSLRTSATGNGTMGGLVI
jgi:hypothetical protein